MNNTEWNSRDRWITAGVVAVLAGGLLAAGRPSDGVAAVHAQEAAVTAAVQPSPYQGIQPSDPNAPAAGDKVALAP